MIYFVSFQLVLEEIYMDVPVQASSGSDVSRFSVMSLLVQMEILQNLINGIKCPLCPAL